MISGTSEPPGATTSSFSWQLGDSAWLTFHLYTMPAHKMIMCVAGSPIPVVYTWYMDNPCIIHINIHIIMYIYIYTSYRQTSFPRSCVVVYPKHPGFISLSTSPCCNLLGKRLRLRTILAVETPRFRVRSVPSMRLKPMTTWSNQNQYKKRFIPETRTCKKY